tara:strand:+ start:624 stop:1079 length:456 start_codon:yes stop_codon:yes gene_type:complete
MANISTYPIGVPGSADLIPATQLFTDENGKTHNLTKNFTVTSIAAFANATAAYTAYAAIVSQASTSAPTATSLQNTTGATFTWARTGAGTYTLTASSSIFTNAKTVCFLNNGGVSDTQTMQWVRTSDTVITITTSADDKITKGSFEVRIYT